MKLLYLWDIQCFVDELKNNKLNSFYSRLFVVLSPLVTCVLSGLFSIMLLSYRFVETFFVDLIVTSHQYFSWYQRICLVATIVTMLITMVGFLWCFYVNKRGDGKHFFVRLACLNFVISFHFIVFILAFFALLFFFSSFILYKKVVLFHASLKKTGVATAIIPFFIKTIGAPLFGGISQKLPTIALRFFESTRNEMLMFYPFIAFIPPMLSFLYYILISRILKAISHV